MFFDLKICVILVIFIDINISQADECPVVRLPQGRIQGRILSSPEGHKRYYAYQEIPYAAPPVGKRRFKEPVEPEHWEGILDTTQNTRSCFWFGPSDELPANVTENEDCLYLNVYTTLTPGRNSSDLLPVLFWIHGGGFIYGDGTFQSYGPQFLIDYGIVIVTLNYRMGPLGFLTTEDGVIPGNLGLRDQTFGLKWVKRNIELFGGDPTKVTIAGESAGGASVGFHLLSKMSEGLFRGAILQSGTPIVSVEYQLSPKSMAFLVGRALDPTFTSTNSSDLFKALQSVTAADIKNITLNVPEEITWGPVTESENIEGTFVTGMLYEKIRIGDINNVPIMIGFNSEEALAIVEDGIEGVKEQGKELDNNPSRIAGGYNMTAENKYVAGLALKKLYTTGSFQESPSAVIKYLSDSIFTIPITRQAELQSNYTDLFLYEFSYKGPMGRTNITLEGADSVAHTEDLKYLWHTDRLDDGTVFPADDIRTQRRLLTLWSNFVKYLNPTPKQDRIFENILWPTVSPGNAIYFNINKTLEVKRDPRQYRKYTNIVDKYVIPSLNSY